MRRHEKYMKLIKNMKLREECMESSSKKSSSKKSSSKTENLEMNQKQEKKRELQEKLKNKREEKKREEQRIKELEFYEERLNNSRRNQKEKKIELAEAILSGPNSECDFHKDFGDIVNVLKEKRRIEHYEIQAILKNKCLNCGISARYISPHITLYEMSDIQEIMNRHVNQCCSKTLSHMQKRGWRHQNGLSTYDWSSIWRKECIDSLEEIQKEI